MDNITTETVWEFVNCIHVTQVKAPDPKTWIWIKPIFMKGGKFVSDCLFLKKDYSSWSKLVTALQMNARLRFVRNL